MSRYVDLNGNTWDGTPITSKIHEMKTKWGYAQGITIGWLFGDNVPHIDLEEHDKEVIQNYIDKVVEEIEDNYGCGNCEQSINIGCNECWESEMIDGILEIVKAGGKNDNM